MRQTTVVGFVAGVGIAMTSLIGFEVRSLQAFCRSLAAGGVQLAQAYSTHDDGVATALLTDPWGTSIELTEGLSRWQ